MQFFFRRSACQLAAATSCLCLLAGTAWSQAYLKPDVLRKYGGNYASNCNNPDAPRLRVLRNALVVEEGDKRLVGRKVQATFLYPGSSTPPAFKLALVGKVRDSSALKFLVFQDNIGIRIHLQADASLQTTLGTSLPSPRYYRCKTPSLANVAAGTTQAEPMSEAEKILLNPAFKASFLRVLGPLARETWLAKFNGPRPPARRVRVGGMEYLLLAVCKPHECAGFNAALLYTQDHDRLFGKVYQQGRIGYLGEPPPDIADALDTLWASQWQPK